MHVLDDHGIDGNALVGPLVAHGHGRDVVRHVHALDHLGEHRADLVRALARSLWVRPLVLGAGAR